MSISIVVFGKLWGLVALHHYGTEGHRVSFPMRQLCRLLSDSIGRNVERLTMAKRLRVRKVINSEFSSCVRAARVGLIGARSDSFVGEPWRVYRCDG